MASSAPLLKVVGLVFAWFAPCGSAETQNAVGDDCSQHEFHVLLTGFGPFLQFTYNPTEDIVATLQTVGCENVRIKPISSSNDALLRICWHAHLLPVNETGALWTSQHLEALIDDVGKVPYAAVLHTGLEDLAKGLKLEVVASNVRANVDGLTNCAVPQAPKLLPTTVNTGWFQLSEIAKGQPQELSSTRELWSRDAGDFYCNEVYYRTLQAIRSLGVKASVGGVALLPAMFLHVPGPNESSLQADVDVVRQVVGHALWGTYLVPDEREAFGLELLGSPVADRQSTLGYVLVTMLSLSLTVNVLILLRTRSRQNAGGIRAPMLGD